MKNQKGFSLIELLIVVAIIGIIAAIAIPNLLAARRSANGASGVSTCRLYATAQAQYQDGLGSGNFASALSLLGGTGDTQLGTLDNTVTVAETVPKSGYLLSNFGTVTASATTISLHSITNAPAARTGITRTGNDSFFIDTTGVLRHSANPNADATSTSPPLN